MSIEEDLFTVFIFSSLALPFVILSLVVFLIVKYTRKEIVKQKEMASDVQIAAKNTPTTVKPDIWHRDIFGREKPKSNLTSSSKQRKILYGFSTVIILFLITDSISFFLYSLLCTLGLSLVVWFPIFYVVGSFVEWLVTSNRSSTYKSEAIVDTNNQLKVGSNIDQALFHYITSAKRAGMSDLSIELALVSRGWDKQYIEVLLKQTK